MEFDCRTSRGKCPPLPTAARIPPVPLIFLRETHYIGRYDGDGIEFACPRLIVELPNRSAATPPSLLAALRSPDFCGFSDIRFTLELWDMPPTTAAGDFNVMTHAWMFGHLDLARKLQNNADVIIGAFEPNGIRAPPPAAAATHSAPETATACTGTRSADRSDNKQALPVNGCRRMRVSMHMKRGSPALSPNNCKLRVENSDRTSSFWLLKGDPATRRAMVSFVSLLPPPSSSALTTIMAEQRKCASEGGVALHALLACLRSHASLSEATVALETSMMVSEDEAPLYDCDVEAAAAVVQLSSVQLGGADAGGGTAAQAPAPTPEAIHAAIKGWSAFN